MVRAQEAVNKLPLLFLSVTCHRKSKECEDEKSGTHHFSLQNYEQVHLNRDVLGDAVDYLTPNLQIKIEFYDGKPVGVELPQTVDLTVVETEPGLKSATASSVTKPAKTETGLVVQVPPFVNEGDKIRVDTSEGAYLSRA